MKPTQDLRTEQTDGPDGGGSKGTPARPRAGSLRSAPEAAGEGSSKTWGDVGRGIRRMFTIPESARSGKISPTQTDEQRRNLAEIRAAEQEAAPAAPAPTTPAPAAPRANPRSYQANAVATARANAGDVTPAPVAQPSADLPLPPSAPPKPPRPSTTVAKPHSAPRHVGPRHTPPAGRGMSDADKLNDISLSLIRRGPMSGAPAAGDAAAQTISKAMGYAKGGLVSPVRAGVVHQAKSNPTWFGPGKPGGVETKYSKRGK